MERIFTYRVLIMEGLEVKDGSVESPLELQSASEPRHKQDVRHSVRLIFSSLQLTEPKLWDSR